MLKFAVGTCKRPNPDTVSDMEDIVKVWSDLDKSQIAERIISGMFFYTDSNNATMAPTLHI